MSAWQPVKQLHSHVLISLIVAANLCGMQGAEDMASGSIDIHPAPEEPEAKSDSQASFAPAEGFGTAFKCLAVTKAGQAPPFPFQPDAS